MLPLEKKEPRLKEIAANIYLCLYYIVILLAVQITTAEKTKANGKEKNTDNSPKVYNVLIFKTGTKAIFYERSFPNFGLFQTDLLKHILLSPAPEFLIQ